MTTRYDPQGGEFRMNTYTSGDQFDPAITSLVGGGFVVTWTADAQDGSEYGVFGQVFDSIGNPLGEEFQVNDYVIRYQSQPATSSLRNGGFVIVWTSMNQDNSGNGIYGQMLNADGSRIGNEFRINSYVLGDQSEPSVTGLADGGFVVTWNSLSQDDSYSDVYGQIYDSNGSRAGSEFRVNTYTTNSQSDHSITSLAGGGFLLTWNSFGQDGSENGIYCQVYGRDGNRIGSEFLVNAYTTGNQVSPSITGLADGGFVVTWASSDQVGYGNGIYGQVYSGDGSRVDGEFRVNSYTSDYQYSPTTTNLADGGFVVAWTSDGQDGSDSGVYGQVYGNEGGRVGSEFRVNTFTTGNQVSPSIIGLADGSFVVTWSSDGQDGSGYGVYGQIFAPHINSLPSGIPNISGTARQGQTLSANVFGVTDADGFDVSTTSYQWLRNGSEITGATASSYQMTQADVGGNISARYSYTDNYGTSESVVSSSSAPVQNVNDFPQGQVLISVVTESEGGSGAAAGGSGGSATEGSYSGAIAASATNGSVSVVGASAGAISRMAPTAATAPLVSAVEGQTLQANASGVIDADGINGSTVAYQWLRDGGEIAGATNSTYQLTQADVGRNVSVRYSYTDNYGTRESVISSATDAILNNNALPAGLVTIGGTAWQGQTLTANISSVTDADGINEATIAYQWLRNGSEITGATGASYRLTQGDVGQTVSFRYSYIDNDGTRESVVSAISSAVQNVNDAPTGSVNIVGNGKVGSTLSVGVATLADADGRGVLSYQWLRDGAAIEGETSSS